MNNAFYAAAENNLPLSAAMIFFHHDPLRDAPLSYGEAMAASIYRMTHPPIVRGYISNIVGNGGPVLYGGASVLPCAPYNASNAS